MNSLNPIYFLYFNLVLYFQKAEKKFGLEDNKIQASLAVGALISFNLLSLFLLVLIKTYSKNDLRKNLMLAIILIVMIVSMISSIIILRKKHESIVEYYTRKTGYWKKYGGALTVFYIILTFLVLYQVAMYGNENWN